MNIKSCLGFLISLLFAVDLAHAACERHAYNNSSWTWKIETEGKVHILAPGQSATIHYGVLADTGKVIVTNQQQPSRCEYSYHYTVHYIIRLGQEPYAVYCAKLDHDRGNTGAVILNDPADGDIVFSDDGGDNGWCFW